MVKVFEANMTIEFLERLENHLIKEYAFASANGISGNVVFTDIHQESDKSYRVNVSVVTERKRQYDSFEAYLELVKTVGAKNKVSVTSLKDVVTKMCRTGLDNTKFIQESENYKIVQDEDTDYLVVKKDNDMILECHQLLRDAQTALSAWSSERY